MPVVIACTLVIYHMHLTQKMFAFANGYSTAHREENYLRGCAVVSFRTRTINAVVRPSGSAQELSMRLCSLLKQDISVFRPAGVRAQRRHHRHHHRRHHQQSCPATRGCSMCSCDREDQSERSPWVQGSSLKVLLACLGRFRETKNN